MSIGFDWFQLEGEEPSPPPPFIEGLRLFFSGEIALPCYKGYFFELLKKWLDDHYVYHVESNAVPYTKTGTTFSGVASVKGIIQSGLEIKVIHENEQRGSEFVVTTSSDGTFSFNIVLGLGKNVITAYYIAESKRVTSNQIILSCYYIHFFLCLYALEYLLYRTQFAQSKQNLYDRYGQVGDAVVSQLFSGDVPRFDSDLNALTNNFGDLLFAQRPENISISDYETLLQDMMKAARIAPTEGAMNFISSAIVGNPAMILNYFDVPWFRIVDVPDSNITKYSPYKLIVGTAYPTVSVGNHFCWGNSSIYLYNRRYKIKKGSHAITSPPYPGAGSIWVYVDGETEVVDNVEYLKVKFMSITQPTPAVAASTTETFVTSDVLTDDDEGSNTGTRNQKYVIVSRRVLNLVDVTDLADIDPTTMIDTKYASTPYSTDDDPYKPTIVGLGTIQQPVNMIQVQYMTRREVLILGRVYYHEGIPEEEE